MNGQPVRVIERVSALDQPGGFSAAVEAVAASLPDPARVAVWLADRSHYLAEVALLVAEGTTPIAAVLTSARPHTAARKIVDVVAPDEQTRRSLVAWVIDDARGRQDIVSVKWEWHPWAAEEGVSRIAGEFGFAALAEPFASVPSTLGGVGGATLWLRGDAPDDAPYYGQTTDFTCGAVSLMMALRDEDESSVPIVRGAEQAVAANRVHELALWRQATNMPACEPVGLAVAAAEHARPSVAAVPEVHVSTDQPILLDGFGDDAAGWRELLQRESWQRASDLGIPVIRDWVSIEAILARVAAGSRALLLIDEEPMHGDRVPHWVFLHAVVGGVGVINDPWVDAAHGETWVDATALPVSDVDLDLMVRYEEPSVRGVIFLD